MHLFYGCLPGVLTDDGRTSSGVFIEDFTLTETTESGECGEGDERNFNEVFIDNTFTTCLDSCADNQHIASDEEINELIADINTSEGLTKEEEDQIKEVVAASRGVCVDDITRPDNAINISTFAAAREVNQLLLTIVRLIAHLKILARRSCYLLKSYLIQKLNRIHFMAV